MGGNVRFSHCSIGLLVFLGWVVPRHGVAEPNKVQYELQERCGKDAADLFKADNPQPIYNSEDGQTVAGYENHYSPELNQCFMLETDTFIGKKNGKPAGWVSYMLIDVNENKQYGNFLKLTIDSNGNLIDPTNYDLVPIVCRVRDTFCHSEAQWKQLLKPYMGDAN